jgi:hypothetical protein
MGASPIVTTSLVPDATPGLWSVLAALPAAASFPQLLAALRTPARVRLEPMGLGVGLFWHEPLRLSRVGLSVGVARWLGHVLLRERGSLAGVRAVVGGDSAGRAARCRDDGHRIAAAGVGDDRS